MQKSSECHISHGRLTGPVLQAHEVEGEGLASEQANQILKKCFKMMHRSGRYMPSGR
jgi:hypothetical protein